MRSACHRSDRAGAVAFRSASLVQRRFTNGRRGSLVLPSTAVAPFRTRGAISLIFLGTALAACASSTPSPSRTAAPPQGYPGNPQGYPPPQQGYPQQGYPQQGYPQGQQGYPPQQPYPAQPPPPPQQPQQPTAQSPFPFPFPFPGATGGTQAAPAGGLPGLGGLQMPVVGTEAQKAETASILGELIQNLPADRQSKVRGIPLVFDPNPDEINAFAGCDERGAPFMAGTVGLLDAVDAIAQTRATDELFGTQTYEAYLKIVIPRLQQPKGGSSALPQGMIAPQHLIDPRRLARARDLFDEIIAFAFGHELAHHYMNHTGCANGQSASGGPDPSAVARLATRIVPLLNQPMETQADTEGTFDVLNTGKARGRANRVRWTEGGGLKLLDFFARLDGIPLFHPIGFLSTHPNSRGRILWVQAVARTWSLQNPG